MVIVAVIATPIAKSQQVKQIWFFICKELVPGYLTGITGEYATPNGYFVDEKEAEEFDQQFP